MAKRAKYEGFLDSLPDSIICHILSFLPTKDAVRTSILSSKWRYLFTSSISTLDFEDCLGGLLVPTNYMNKFKKFVDRLFFNPKHLRLECLRMNDLWVDDRSSDDGFLSMHNWLCAALWRGVKEIDVDLFHGDLRILPTLLFTCPSLVTLKLHINGSEMKVPTTVCLPNLRILHLSDMEFVDGFSILGLISGCPVLEDLGLFQCFLNGTSELTIYSLSLKRLVLDFETFAGEGHRDFDNVIVIYAPNLVCVQYIGLVGKGYTIRNTESLEKADIRIFHFNDVDRERSADLLRGICNVQTLHLTIHDYGEPLFRSPLDSVFAFHNLVELKFKNPRDDWKGTWIVEFLHCVPILKTLLLDLADANKGFKPLPEDVPSCLFYHLKEIDILYFKGDTHMFEMVSFFLKHALVLEKLMISINVAQVHRSNIIEKLLSLPKNSKKCQFVVL